MITEQTRGKVFLPGAFFGAWLSGGRGIMLKMAFTEPVSVRGICAKYP